MEWGSSTTEIQSNLDPIKKQLESQDPNCPTICKKMCGKPTTPNLHSKIDNPS